VASSHRAEAPCLVRCPRAPSQGTRHQAPGSNERGASLWGFNEALLGTAHAEQCRLQTAACSIDLHAAMRILSAQHHASAGSPQHGRAGRLPSCC
jgi:hypothetical protein